MTQITTTTPLGYQATIDPTALYRSRVGAAIAVLLHDPLTGSVAEITVDAETVLAWIRVFGSRYVPATDRSNP